MSTPSAPVPPETPGSVSSGGPSGTAGSPGTPSSPGAAGAASSPGATGAPGAAGAPSTPATRAARHGRIAEILGRMPIRSQSELADQLAQGGIAVTQGTLSRDLDELGAVKIRSSHGWLVYALPGEGGDPTPRSAEDAAIDARLIRVCEEILVSARSSANLVVLRTPPGAAQYLASAIDHAVHPELLGTIAGDDTVLVISADPEGGDRIAAWFLSLAEGRAP